jgi:hypothetical protein
MIINPKLIARMIVRETNFWHKIRYLYIVRKHRVMAGKKRIRKDESSGKVTLRGRVILKKFAEGSKSEHDAVYLETNQDTYVLRRVGGNAFYDEILRSLVGKDITAVGTVKEPYFMITNFEVKDE